MGSYCKYCMAPMENTNNQCLVCGREENAVVPAHHLLPGTILNGRFYVGVALGEGGFGITYIGRDIKLDMKVAIKEFYPNGYVNRSNTISPWVSDSVTECRKEYFEKGRERFLQEARILAQFVGEPGVVNVRDFFEENNTAYIIMEYVEGVDLKTYIKEKGTLSPKYTIQLLMPVMESLGKIHARGLIHRDISPDNIMVNGDKVKLLDFGAARNVSSAENKSLSVMLKHGYAPEEQYRSKGRQGPWTDIYALCATMYKCITGITPDDAIQRMFNDEVKKPSELDIAITPQIENTIMQGMGVRQTERYQCIEDLIGALQSAPREETNIDCTTGIRKTVADDDFATICLFEQSKPAPLPAVEEIGGEERGETIDEANKLLGANQSIEEMDNSKTDIDYGPNTATGGIDLVDSNKKQTKRKGVALALAIFPYTGFFGVHDFYLGKKASGFLKLFTVNFYLVGWVTDIIMILCDKYKTKDGEFLK